MKKLAVLVLLLLGLLNASPVYDPSPTIYELQIITENNWNIEINLFQEDTCSPDSFMIKNKNDSAMVLTYTRFDSVGYYQGMGAVLVINQNDLSKPLSFDKDNDIISLCYFVEGEKFTKSLEIGDYPEAWVANITPDQSICWDGFWKEYYKSSPPTIGTENTSGITHVYGKVFDAHNIAISNSTIYFYPLYNMAYKTADIDESGMYHTFFTSRRWSFSSLSIKHDNGFHQDWDINDVIVDLEPNDSIEVNFYSTMTGIIPVVQSPITMNSYPQPATNYSWFSIENADVDASAMRMNVYDISGRKVDSFIPQAYQLRYDCSHLPQGTYIMSLQQGKQKLAVQKLQIIK